VESRAALDAIDTSTGDHRERLARERTKRLNKRSMRRAIVPCVIILAFLFLADRNPLLASPHLLRLRDVRSGQPGAYPCPCDQELGLAVVEVNAVPAVVVERLLAVKVAAPPPPANAGAFHDPAYRQVAPEHGVVVRVAFSADHGVAHSDCFVVELRPHISRNATHIRCV
jgi:hypothetical protein